MLRGSAHEEPDGPVAVGPRLASQEVKSVWANLRKWNRGARDRGVRVKVFVMSLGDFAEDRRDLDDVRARAWDAMRACDQLDFQMLTKRPERYPEVLPSDWGEGWPHVWLGTSIGHPDAVVLADALRAVPAQVRFLLVRAVTGATPDPRPHGDRLADRRRGERPRLSADGSCVGA